MKLAAYFVLSFLLLATSTAQAAVSGNPSLDGWTSHGNSLSQGVYVRGSANYGYDAYSSTFAVDLAIAGDTGWDVGDTLIGVGGVFQNITASAAGWDSGFTGTAVNSLLASSSTGPKIQVKFGTNAPDGGGWTTSTIAPGLGNGQGSISYGGTGSVQIRSSGYNDLAYWTANDEQLNPLQSSSHITRAGSSAPNANVARMIWTVAGGELASWQLLLNVTLLTELYPATYNPSASSMALMTVQNGDNAYTDALIPVSASVPGVVPEPASLVVWSLLALAAGGAGWWRQRKAAA